MSHARRTLIAICTVTALAAFAAPVATADPAEFSRYQRQELDRGAVTLPVAAALEYRDAIESLGRGDRAEAARHLQNALELRPQYADAHFTLARIRARELNPEAVYHFVQGFLITATAFEAQRMLAVNLAAILIIVLIMASAIVWIALAIRYFPFIIHSMDEFFRTRFNAAGGRIAAFLLVLTPFALLPGYATAAALVLLGVWPFMPRRERVLALAMTAAFAMLAWSAPAMDRYSTVAAPNSFVSLIARANDSSADESLARALAAADAKGMEAERETALGLLATRAGQTDNAAAHLLRSISIKPDDPVAYINLGNVYYLNGQYVKALEGYRKAEQADSTDAVAQFNLAQAYIKTLLMSESSHALARASKLGVESVASSIARPARERMPIYPRPYGSRDLWRMAGIEGSRHNPGLTTNLVANVTGQSARVGFWIAVTALVLVMVVQRTVRPHRVAFQCSNCGNLACGACCREARGLVLCQTCASGVDGVTSDKVMDALLRQRRQSVVIKRRHAMRWMTIWLPGLRHVHYGRAASGFMIAALFSFSALMIWTRGYPVPDWNTLPAGTPLWKWILPALGVALSYYVALTARQYHEVRNTRAGSSRSRAPEPYHDTTSQSA